MGYPIEVKHVGGREPLEVIIDRYQPQMQWQMYVTGATQCALSVIMGANEPIVEYIDRDDDYIQEMFARATIFMRCVWDKVAPVAFDPVPPPAIAEKVYDMADDMAWKGAAQRWLQAYGAAQTAKEAERELKFRVPGDAKKCHGHGVQITRDRAGRLSLRSSRNDETSDRVG